MDKQGVATAVLSLTFPGIWFGDPKEAARMARRVNEYSADLARSHPGRFAAPMLCFPLANGTTSKSWLPILKEKPCHSGPQSSWKS
jgi:hypothetical protein